MSQQYVKVDLDQIVYYIARNLFARIELNPNHKPHMQLLQLADFAVDTANNTIVKCRLTLEDLIDRALIK